MQKQKRQLHFPKRFLWGVATSAHQVEGNTHNQWSVWELETAKSRAAQAEYHYADLDTWDQIKTQAKSPETYVSGQSTDHYSRYEEDFDFVKKLNCNAFRFSVEWSRVEPQEGVWNVEAIEHYKRYVAELKKRSIEPMVTLFHFTLPTWFTDKGGFEKSRNIKYFTRFADKIIRELGSPVKYVITINEPEVYVYNSYIQGNWPPNVTSKHKSYHVTHNLITAHNKVAKLIHGINRRYKISVAKNSSYIYPGDDAHLSRASAATMQYIRDDYMLKRMVKSCDFLGVNYYFSDRVYGYRVHNPDERLSDLGWDLQPAHVQYALERLYAKYKLPIIITENGLADADDNDRQWWLTQTLIAMQHAMDEGVKLEGYFHWSLLDNFEWAEGTWPRFGLLEVDYKTLTRTPRPSAVWFSKVLKQIRKDAET